MSEATTARDACDLCGREAATLYEIEGYSTGTHLECEACFNGEQEREPAPLDPGPASVSG